MRLVIEEGSEVNGGLSSERARKGRPTPTVESLEVAQMPSASARGLGPGCARAAACRDDVG